MTLFAYVMTSTYWHKLHYYKIGICTNLNDELHQYNNLYPLTPHYTMKFMIIKELNTNHNNYMDLQVYINARFNDYFGHSTIKNQMNDTNGWYDIPYAALEFKFNLLFDDPYLDQYKVREPEPESVPCNIS